MRPDAMVDDIPHAHVRHRQRERRWSTRVPEPWRRHLAIVLDGLRAEAAERHVASLTAQRALCWRA